MDLSWTSGEQSTTHNTNHEEEKLRFCMMNTYFTFENRQNAFESSPT